MKIPSYIVDKKLYEMVRDHVHQSVPKHSAFRSMQVMKMYKDNGGTFKRKNSKSGRLQNWRSELWKNLSPYALGYVDSIKDCPSCGTKHQFQKDFNIPSICRPTKKINDSTPKLAQTFTRHQIQRALFKKMMGKTIKWDEL